MTHPVGPIVAMTTLLAMIMTGCDDRATQIAVEAADRQAEQNREMAQLNREVAAGTSRLVIEEAKAREQALQVHRQLQDERAGLRTGWDELEAERRQVAQSRRIDSALSALVSGSGAMLAALLALALAWLVLYRGHDASEPAPALYAEVVDVLLADPSTSPQLSLPVDPKPQLTHEDP
jgi:hypothetical protein